jgi:ligand-binding SRPBCC domain-containing protein
MINISAHSGIYTLDSHQFLKNISLQEAWDFFSSPKNLAKITPKHMGFHITSSNTDKMHPGQIITYRIGLLPGIKSSWVTEITHVQDMEFFVDEQRFGPYKMWHHEHWFEEKDGGVMMFDRVSYKLPFGVVGRLFNGLIKKQLVAIFEHRTQVLNELFN